MDIATTALTDLENLYRQWHEDTSTFLDGVVTRTQCKILIDDSSIPDLDKWGKFPDLLYFAKTDDSYIENEIKNNLLIFNRDGLEYAYLQRLDSLYGNIESASNNYIEKFNYVHKRVSLSLLAEECSHVLLIILREFRQVQFVLTRSVQDSFLVGEHPEKFPYLGPFVRMYHQSKVQFAKDPNKGGIAYEQDENRDWIQVGRESQPTEPEPDKVLSAAQRLLFVRLLQEQGLFPKKPANTDDAPELKAIALLTGLSFENQIKGNSGAAAKVNQLLNNLGSITRQQAKHKLDDLDRVEQVARLLNVDSVVERIGQIREDLNQREL